ncbi:restriction endonuclease subunit S [Candidatus Saccharibacteria bacterium]|nr:restriction endonuclease subunit S [Candidatus Saccharibacteria bacterium]
MANAKSTTPALRFRGFDDEWKKSKLGDLTARIVRKNINNESKLPLTISAQYGLVDQITYFNNRVASRDVSGYYLVFNGEFAYNKSSSDGFPFGTIKRLDLYEKGVLSTLYIVFGILNVMQTDSDYLTTFFDTDKWHKGIAERAAEGARNHGLLNISADDFMDIDLVHPSNKAEQTRIGKFFQNLDSLIALQRRKLVKLQNVKKAMLQKMFPTRGSTTPQIRFAGFTEPWQEQKLGDLAAQTYGGGTPATANEKYWGGDIPWIQSSDLTENKLSGVVPRKYVTNAGLRASATRLVPKNSIAIITRVGVGKLAIMPFAYTTSQDFLSLSNLKANAQFSAYVIYNRLQSELHAVQGTSIKGITKEELLAKELLLPDEKEQIKIGIYFKQLDTRISLQQLKLEKLQNVKKACLAAMFV